MAAVSLVKRKLIPVKEQCTAAEVRNRLEYPAEDSILAKDSRWLHARMARSTKTRSPDEEEPEEDAEGMAVGQAVCLRKTVTAIIRKTMLVMVDPSEPDRRAWSVRDLTKLIAKRKPDELLEAIGTVGYFLRVYDSDRLYRNAPIKCVRREHLDLDRLEKILARYPERNEIFGTFHEWCEFLMRLPPVEPGVAYEGNDCDLPDSEFHVDFQMVCSQIDTCRLLPEHIDVARLREYAAVGDDPRQEQIDGYLTRLAASGLGDPRAPHLMQPYKKKVYSGAKVGREIPPWYRIPFMSRGARAAAAPDGAIISDISNAAFEGARVFAERHDKSSKLLARYNAHRAAWRDVIRDYYEITPEDSKRHMMPTLYLRPYAPRRMNHKGILPFVECLAQEAGVLRRVNAALKPALVHSLREDERPNPERSAWAITLQDEENALVTSFLDVASKHGLNKLIALIFDETWHMPENPDPINLEVLQSDFKAATGASIKCKRARPASACVGAVVRTVRSRVEDGELSQSTIPIIEVEGTMVCACSVLVNLFPDDTQVRQFVDTHTCGPYTYGYIASQLPHIQFTLLHSPPCWADGEEQIVIHEMRRLTEVGHASGVHIHGGAVWFYDESQTSAVLLPPHYCPALFGDNNFVRCIRVCAGSCNQPTSKRQRIAPSAVNMDVSALLAGGAADTDGDDHVAFLLAIDDVVEKELGSLFAGAWRTCLG